MDDNIVVIIEDTQTKLQALLSTMVNDRIKRDIIGNEAKQIITNCIKRLNDQGCERDFVEKQRQAFMTTFLNWYMRITANLAKLAQKTKNPTFYQSYTEIVGVEPKTSGKSMIISLGQNDLRAGEGNNIQNIEVGGIKNIRDYFTTGETGYSQMFIEDYQKRVNQEIMRIASQNVVLVNRKGRAISARNLAEMQVRFEEQVKDMERLKEKGAKFVVATSHANASERCQPWQGKIFELDAKVGDVTIGKEIQHGEPKPIGKTPDGKDYYSLEEAMTHGFLGYNCRHRLILYKPGMIMPKEYTANQVSKERSIETTARSLERQIRVAKKRALLSSDKEERKKFREKSKKLQDVYWQYCKEHDYPVAEWRTRVVINEREGLKSGGISSEINSNNKGNEYESLEVSQSYRAEKRNISLEDRIETIVGRTNKTPKLMQEKLGLNKKSVIFFERATKYREGSAEHILSSHRNELSIDYINNLRDTLQNPDFITDEGKTKDGLYRYTLNKELYVKNGVRRVFRIVIDRTTNNAFRIVSGYIRKIKKG